MSLFTQSMREITAVTLQEDRDRVIRALISIGSLDFVKLSELEETEQGRLKSGSGSEIDALGDFRTRLENLFSQGGMLPPTLTGDDIKDAPGLDTRKLRALIDSVTEALQKVKDRQRVVNQRLLQYSEMLGYLSEEEGGFLSVRTGTVPERKDDFLRRMQQDGAVTAEENGVLILLSLKRDEARTAETLRKFSFTETEAEAKNRKLIKSVLEKKTADASAELRKYTEDARKEVSVHKEELESAWRNVRVLEISAQVESYFTYTRNTCLFSGWVPEEKYEATVEAIKEATGGRCIIEDKPGTELPREKVPTSLTNHKFFAPFEHLVDNYGVPEYGSINPTPFTAVSYMAMFCLMFADVGQGFVLLLAGILGKAFYRKHPLQEDGLISRYLCNLLCYLGPASIFGGLLFGSCFGYSWIPALWFNFHHAVEGHGTGVFQDVYDILGLTIKFGIIVIGTGLVLNWINLARKKRWFELVFDKNGLVGGALYAVGVWMGFGFVGSNYKTFPSAPWLMPALIVPIALIVIKEPLHFILEKRKGHSEKIGQVVINTVMETFITLLEIFSGFLANTLSFMRVAGLGIAHASLMTAFQDMAAMTGGGVMGIVIIILGNVLVIVLEGLSAGINSLRLNYYEFFTKYFTGSGIAYEPIGLEGRRGAER